MPANIAGDLVFRLAVQHRNEMSGRGQHDGSWMSALGRDDLSNVLVSLYQQPVHHVEEPHRALTFDTRNKVDKALDGLDTAHAVMSFDAGALIGKALGPKEVVQFTAFLMDTGSFCSFRLAGNNQPLSKSAPWIADSVLHLLERLEAAALLRRCAFGWEHDIRTLLQTPSSDIVQRIASVVGEFDARVLGRPRDQR